MVAAEGQAFWRADAADGSPGAASALSAMLPFTRACVLEATRLYPAAPLLLRVALRDTSLGGVHIPAGSGIVASTVQIGRQPSIWVQADAFVPERFLPGHPLHRNAEAARAYLPFGAGPRSCVGQQLAVTLATLALAHAVMVAQGDDD